MNGMNRIFDSDLQIALITRKREEKGKGPSITPVCGILDPPVITRVKDVRAKGDLQALPSSPKGGGEVAIAALPLIGLGVSCASVTGFRLSKSVTGTPATIPHLEASFVIVTALTMVSSLFPTVSVDEEMHGTRNAWVECER